MQTKAPLARSDQGKRAFRLGIIGAALTLWSGNLMAQESLAVGACVADIKSLCPVVQSGFEPIRGCFREHIKEISGPCLVTLAKLLEVDPVCKAHLNQACGDVKIGEGRLEACLKSALAGISDSCKDALVRAVPGAR